MIVNHPVTRTLLASATAATLILHPHLGWTEAATETLTLQTIPQQFELDATLEAINQSTVSAQTSGAIKAIYFDVNDAVEAGSLLLEIDNIQQQAALSQARANLAQAKAQNEDAQVLLKRNKRLFKQRTLSQGELDGTTARAKSAAAAVRAAQAGEKQAREQLTYTQVRAPYSGIVKARHVEIGELVAPGAPLMTGLSLKHLRAVADAPQRLARQYTSAEQIQVEVNGVRITPEKVTLFPYADSTLHSVRLRADLPVTESNLLPGSWAKVIMTTGERQAITVPAGALIRRSELAAVYVINRGKAALRQVRVGNQSADRVEILSGLNPGDVIYTDGYGQLAALNNQSSE